MTTLLKNGTVIDYKTKIFAKKDILIEETKIKQISDTITENADKIILNIIPGMIDVHCHLREPGFEYKETIKAGSKSAVAGGFITICPMANTRPTHDSTIILQKIIEEAKKVRLCNILPYAPVTNGAINAGKIAEKLELEGVKIK